MFKKIFALSILSLCLFLTVPPHFNQIQARSYRTTSSDVHVNGYYRKNGTYVQPYYRSKADGTIENNYSCIDDGKCGGSSVTTPNLTTPATTPDSPLPTARPKPTQTPEQIKAARCTATVNVLHKKITTQENLKLKNVLALRTLVKKLNLKNAVQGSALNDQVETYRLAYDAYTNKLYESLRQACGENQTEYIKLLDEERGAFKALATLKQTALKTYSTATN